MLTEVFMVRLSLKGEGEFETIVYANSEDDLKRMLNKRFGDALIEYHIMQDWL